jgi:cyclopropane fatty-acyl-phospholipid synthase-like methyltransferase
MSANVNSITEHLLIDAGISTGMRVLDIGCGSGEVSLLLARMVGPEGEVLGIDHDEKSILIARERVQGQSLSNVNFLKSDLSKPLPELGFFDAAVGRRILMYLPNPADTIRHISAALQPSGVIIFQESDATMVPGRLKSLPLHEQVNDWIRQTVEREGANIHMGFDLPSTFEQAGLTVECIRAEAIIQGQNTHYPLATVVRAMLPRIIQHGVATETEIDIETLDQRLKAERPPDVVYVSDMAFGVWARKP